jgi:aromatic ring-opening dioxygenase catalytic subunit (LigB family)
MQKQTDPTIALSDPASTTPLPTWFVPHGAGPCFFMDWDPPHAWDAMAAFLRGLRHTLADPPKAILLVSAHWLAPQWQLSGAAQPELIYDYGGFPPHTYALRYPAPGAPALAQQVAGLLGQAGLPAGVDAQRGFDHGMFIPLMLMFPDATVPVVQLSLHSSLDASLHLRAGQTLAPLRQQGVLIVGSGMSFHNMRGYGDARYAPISEEFDAWLTQAVQLPAAERTRALAAWAQAPQARACHPPRAEEHLLPLMVVAGAAGADAGRKVFSDRVLQTTLSAFAFGT